MSSKHTYYFKSGIVGVGSKILKGFSGITTLWLCTQILSPAMFGTFVLTKVITNITTEMALLGLNDYLVHRVPKLIDDDRHTEARKLTGNVFLLIILLISIVVLALIGIRSYIEYFFDVEGLAFWLFWLALLAPLANVIDVHSSWLKANERIPENYFLNGILPNAIGLITLFYVWWEGIGALGIIGSIFIKRVISLAPWLISERLFLNFGFSYLDREDLNYSLKLFGGYVSNMFNNNLDLLMLSWLGTSSQTAIYKVGTTLASIVVHFQGLMGTMIEPRISQLIGREDKTEFKREYKLIQKLGLALTLVFSGIFLALGKPLLPYFGETYVNSFSVSLIILAARCFSNSTGMIGKVLSYGNLGGWLFLNGILLNVINFVGNLLLIPIIGATGAAFTWGLSIAVGNLNGVILSRIYKGINFLPLDILWKSLTGIVLIGIYLLGYYRNQYVLGLLLLVPAILLLKESYPKIRDFVETNLNYSLP